MNGLPHPLLIPFVLPFDAVEGRLADGGRVGVGLGRRGGRGEGHG
jgi:hypothetical protein